MREIKFRGRTFKGDWVYGDLKNDSTGLSFYEEMWIRDNLTENRGEDTVTAYWNKTTKRICWREGTAFCNAPVEPETVGQYTGLKDKNGTEIYEGDKVGMCERGNEWVIEWGYFGDAGFYAHNQINSGRTLDVSDYEDHAVVEITPDEILICEVIGNIHDKGNA